MPCTSALRAITIGALFAAIPRAACAQTAEQPRAAITQARWLVGCWTRQEPRGGETLERWHAAAGQSMLGLGRTIRNDSLRHYEFFLLSASQPRLSYTAHVPGQPQTEFLATVVNDSVLQFENPQHDFPQEVRYRRVNADSIVATIAGPRGGVRREIATPYKRTRCPD